MAPRLSTTRAIRAFAFQPSSGSVPLNVYARAPIGCVANRGFHEAATCAVVAFSDGPAHSTRNGPVVVVSLPDQNRLEASFLHICTGRANVVDLVQLWGQRSLRSWFRRRVDCRFLFVCEFLRGHKAKYPPLSDTLVLSYISSHCAIYLVADLSLSCNGIY